MLTNEEKFRLFSRLKKRVLIFRIEQFYKFFEFCPNRSKFTFANRCYMFKFFTFEKTFLFKKNPLFFVN